jgi:ATP-dependent exoDNAse (exonuclease V) beta subunit
MGKAVCDAMNAANIPFTWLKDAASKRQFDVSEDSVKIITMHSSKGL